MKSSKIRRGIALMLVIVVLAMLILIAVPFAASMRVERRAVDSHLAQVRARLIAEGAFRYAVSRLSLSHHTIERYAPQKPYDTPDYDDQREYRVAIDIPNHATRDPQGEIWSVEVEDEQGKIDINSATVWQLGNLLGSAIVTEAIPDYSTTIWVDSTHNFPPRDGFLWVDGELISYRQAKDKSFTGCKRGIASNSPEFSKAREIPRGAMIVDARAYEICRYRITRGFFNTVEQLKDIASLGRLTLPQTLLQRLKPLVTVHARRYNAEGWGNSQSILLDLPGSDTSKADTIVVNNTTFYGIGTTVQIREGGANELAMVMAVGGNTLQLNRRLENKFNAGQATVRALEPHRVNINSAPPKVLFSLLKGLHGRDNWVDRKEASLLTSAIIHHRQKQGAFHSLAHFTAFFDLWIEKMRQHNVVDERDRPVFSPAERNAVLSSAFNASGERRRFAGITIPQNSSEYVRPLPALSPWAFANDGTYTITATGVVNNDEGIPLAQYTTAKIVDVVPAETLRWSVESQLDFERYLAQLPSRRVITWPNLVRRYSSFADETRDDRAGISLDTVAMFPKKPQGAMNSSYLSFDNTHEGIVCENAHPILLQKSGLQLSPGSLSFWCKPLRIGSDRYSLFTVGNLEGRNQLTCFFERGNLVLEASDTTIVKAATQVFAPVPLRTNRWSHITAAWHSTQPGGLALWVDGQPVGQFRYLVGKNPIRITLAQTIDSAVMSIPLSSTSSLPSQGAIQVGSEVIEYQKIVGDKLVVRKGYTGFVMATASGRGTRGTQALPHPKGAAVAPFGYSDLLTSTIFPATKLDSNLAQETVFARSVGNIKALDKTIAVVNSKGFPPSGFIVIADEFSNKIERVRYFGIQGNQLTNCQRGQLGTSASDFGSSSQPAQAFIFPISLLVGDNRKYPNSGIVQIDDEWIQYGSKVDDNLLVCTLLNATIDKCKTTGEYKPEFRGVKGTSSATHLFGAKVIPVFQVGVGHPGKFDRVTVIADNDPLQSEEMVVNWASDRHVAFTEDPSREYKPGKGTRLLQFPSGELPSTLVPGSFSKEKGAFIVDEIQLVQLQNSQERQLSQPISENKDELPGDFTGFPTDGGLVKVGDEYISYSQLLGGEAKGIERGVFSNKSAHSQGTPVFPVFFVPCSSLVNTVGVSQAIIELRNAKDFPSEGYILCGDEVIGYSQKKSRKLIMPLVSGKGGLRGAFATRIQQHSEGSIALSLPVRYWDRAIAQYDGPEQAYCELAKTARGAFWQSITWEEDNPAPQQLKVKILARIDGKPEWQTAPTNRPGGIYAFSDPKADNRLHIRGDTLELRVYFPYENRAFAVGHWKEKVRLKSLYVAYRQGMYIYQSE